jgi:nitroimidazol reductase NimA-like FMN-containing flavoprotein (pyridoxamine 5'-phosphate oxidase superfamily)
MPKDYDPAVTAPNTQRRPQNALDDAATRALLETLEIGHIATAWGEQPFINPTTFWYDAEVHAIYFHSNLVGRMRANAEHNRRVCFEASRFGRFLPSNVALEFSVQYESVVVFGEIDVVQDNNQKRRALSGLLGKYFPAMRAGEEYRPITEPELKRTSVYAIAVKRWSGKRNWAAMADQSDEWAPLPKEWLA